MNMKKTKRAIGLLLAALAAATVVNCSRIHEPWVPSENTLKEERARAPEQQQNLRERLATGQIDR